MLKKIFIFRHGETDWNIEERFQGHINIPLNNHGRKQASMLIPFFEKNSIEAILSSDLSRALETAQIVAHALKIQVFQDPGLREADLGLAQGMTRTEIEAQFGASLAQSWRSTHVSDADVSYPGGETGNQIFERSFRAITHFFSTNPFNRIGVACHGGVIRRIIHRILPPGSPPIPIPNGVVYQLEYNSQKNTLSIEN